MENTLIVKSDVMQQFGSTKIHIQSLALMVSEVDIQDESSLSIATGLAIQLNGVIKKIEEKRKILKEPFLDAGKVIDGIAKDLTGDGNEAIKSAKAKILFWNDRVKEKKIEELSSVDEQFPLEKEEIITIVNQEKVSNVRRNWTWKISNHDAIPEEWMMLNVDKVKQYLSDNKDSLKEGQVVNGIEFYKSESIVLR